MNDDKTVLSKIREIVLDIDPEDVLKDAREYGLSVSTLQDLASQSHDYIFIEKLMEKYATLAASYCAMSGAVSGIGGVATAVTLAGADISNMAAQLYRLNQKMAILNGFDPQSTYHIDKSQFIYLKALGFDAAAQSVIRTQVAKAALENVSKSGPSSNATIRLIMAAAQVLQIPIKKSVAVKFIPILGAAIGGGLNYKFAKNAAETMMSEYKLAYFDRLQATARQTT